MKLFGSLTVILFLFASTILGVEFDPAFQISTPGQTVNSPSAGIDGTGNIVVVWRNNTLSQIQSSLFNGTVWVGPTTVSPLTETLRSNPQVSVSEAGNVVAIWVQGTAFLSTFASFFDGVSWSAPFTTSVGGISPVTPQRPDIVINDSGVAMAIWQVGTGQMESRRFNGVTWAAAQNVAGADVFANPIVDIDAAGNSLVIYRDVTLNVVRASRHNGTTWAAAVTLSDTGATNPYISVQSNGEALAVWSRAGNIEAARFNGTTWELPATIISTMATGTTSPIVSVNDSGIGMAIWSVGSTTMRAARFNGTTWEEPITVGTGATSMPFVGIDAFGGAVAVWSSGGPVSYSTFNGISWNAQQDITDSTDALFATGAVNNTGQAAAAWDVSAGNAIFSTFGESSILPPTDLSGEQLNNRFAFQSEYYNLLTWGPSASDDVVQYNVYRGLGFIGSVPSSGPLRFEDHGRIPGVPVTYGVAAVNSSGEQSTAITITIP